MTSDLARTALALERELLTAEVRSNPVSISRLLHEDFVEHGASGRRWTRDEVIAAVPREADTGPIEVSNESATALGDGVVLVTYRSSRGGRLAWRSSVWVLDDDRCQMVFHQGTEIGTAMSDT